MFYDIVRAPTRRSCSSGGFDFPKALYADSARNNFARVARRKAKKERKSEPTSERVSHALNFIARQPCSTHGEASF